MWNEIMDDHHKKIYDHCYGGEGIFRQNLQRAKTLSLRRLLSKTRPANPNRPRLQKTKTFK